LQRERRIVAMKITGIDEAKMLRKMRGDRKVRDVRNAHRARGSGEGIRSLR
jgi:hypothetical protein